MLQTSEQIALEEDDLLRVAGINVKSVMPERIIPGPMTGLRPSSRDGQILADQDYEGRWWL